MGDSTEDLKAAAQYPEGDIVRLLLEQHARIRTLFADLRDAGGREEVADIFAELRMLLVVHETAEQIVVHPVSKELAGADVTRARIDEEAEATKLLAELEKLDPMTPEFEADLGRLEAAVDQHAEAEEHEEFPVLVNGCPAEQRQHMGAAFRAAAAVAPTHPHPAVAGKFAATMLTLPVASIVDRTKDAIKKAS